MSKITFSAVNPCRVLQHSALFRSSASSILIRISTLCLFAYMNTCFKSLLTMREYLSFMRFCYNFWLKLQFIQINLEHIYLNIVVKISCGPFLCYCKHIFKHKLELLSFVALLTHRVLVSLSQLQLLQPNQKSAPASSSPPQIQSDRSVRI